MNRQRRKRLEKSYGLIDEAMEIIQEVMDEEQEAYDNLPENFQNGEREEEIQFPISYTLLGYYYRIEELTGVKKLPFIGTCKRIRMMRGEILWIKTDYWKS